MLSENWEGWESWLGKECKRVEGHNGLRRNLERLVGEERRSGKRRRGTKKLELKLGGEKEQLWEVTGRRCLVGSRRGVKTIFFNIPPLPSTQEQLSPSLLTQNL